MPSLRPSALLAVLVAWSLGAVQPAAAEYVVFRDGRSLKVRSYRFEGRETAIELAGGGSMRFATAMVQYVAPDEDVEAQPRIRVATLEAAASLPAPGWRDIADPRFVAPILRSSERHAMDPALVAAVIKVESDYRPRAVSPKGAMGLMQLMPGTARELGVKDPWDPEANIEGGVSYLKKLLDRYEGDRSLALAAYNAGARTVDRARGIPRIAETRDYVSRVLAWAGRMAPAVPELAD